jgi:two-component system chemotaxis response regulator CheY
MSRKILVVEDDQAIREVLTEVLRYEGFDAFGAANGREALSLLEGREAPSLIILDLMMPVMNGWEFLDRIHQTPALAAIPVIVASAGLSRPGAPDAAIDFMRKPIDLDEFIARVRKRLEPAA